jgi:leucyl-tRNA synthetase
MDGKKMSKSEGNFLTLEEAISEYSADGARLTCANAGDSNEFANFERDVADSAVRELFKLEEKAQTMLQDEQLREGEMSWLDKMFAGDIEFTVNVTAEHFNGMRFREGLKTGFYEFLNMQARYKMWTRGQGMHKDLLKKYLQMQAMVLAPICPHTAEAVWAHGGGEGSIFDASWPEKTYEFTKYHRASVFLHKFIQAVREQVEKSKKGKKAIQATKAVVYVANTFSEVQQKVLEFLRAEFDAKGEIAPSFKGELQKILTTEGGLDKKGAGVALGFAAFIVKNLEEQGPDVLDKELPFDQAEVLQQTADFFTRELGLELQIHDASSDCPDPKKKKDQAYPAAPQFYLE